MNPIIGVAVYIVLWWLAFFALLPIGARSLHEAGEAAAPGAEVGAPRAHRLGAKALAALLIAAILWLGVSWAVRTDLFHVLPR